MFKNYEGEGLELFFRVVFALAAISLLAIVIGIGWGLWKWLA
jgi:hypothetical protein